MTQGMSGPQGPNPNQDPGRINAILHSNWTKAAGAVMALSLTAGIVQGCRSEGDPVASTATTTTEASTTTTQGVTTTTEACATTWKRVDADAGTRHRYIDTGVASILNPDMSNPDAAKVAADEWLGVIKTDPELLAGAANVSFENKEFINSADLADGTGCITEKGKTVYLSLETKVKSSELAITDAPENGTNSGTDDNGNVVFADQAGVNGNRKSLKITGPDGKTIYVLGRCGNIVTETGTPPPPGIPKYPHEKFDDGVLPGDGTPASQDHGTPDVPGQGPAGQTPNTLGYTPNETMPSAPATTATSEAHPTTTGRPTATTTPAPTSTNPPATATTVVATTVPGSTIPKKP